MNNVSCNSQESLQTACSLSWDRWCFNETSDMNDNWHLGHLAEQIVPFICTLSFRLLSSNKRLEIFCCCNVVRWEFKLYLYIYVCMYVTILFYDVAMLMNKSKLKSRQNSTLKLKQKTVSNPIRQIWGESKAL